MGRFASFSRDFKDYGLAEKAFARLKGRAELVADGPLATRGYGLRDLRQESFSGISIAPFHPPLYFAGYLIEKPEMNSGGFEVSFDVSSPEREIVSGVLEGPFGNFNGWKREGSYYGDSDVDLLIPDEAAWDEFGRNLRKLSAAAFRDARS